MSGENLDFLTARQIVSPARDEALSSSTPQISALQDTQITEFIHWLNGEFVFAAHGSHANIIIPSSFTGFSWMKKTTNLSFVTHNSLSAAAAASAATFSLTSATNWDNTGRTAFETTRGAVVFVDHESKASNTLTVSTATGAQTISIALASGSRANKLYALPSDFGRVHHLFVNTLPFAEEKMSGMFPRGGRFSVFGSYLFMPRGMYTADGTLLYEKAPTEIATLDTTTNIPRRALRWAIESTLFHLFRIKRKRGDLVTTDQLAERELQKIINYDMLTSTGTQIRLA